MQSMIQGNEEVPHMMFVPYWDDADVVELSDFYDYLDFQPPVPLEKKFKTASITLSTRIVSDVGQPKNYCDCSDCQQPQVWAPPPPKKEKTKKVTFSTVEVRDYALIVSDNPSCLDGLALGLDWKHTKSRVHDLEQYTSTRSYERLKRKRSKKLHKLNAFERKERLKRAGGYRERHLRKLYHKPDVRKLGQESSWRRNQAAKLVHPVRH